MTRSLRTFHAFGRAPDSLSLESVPGGSSAAGSTCSRQVLASLPTPRESPARPSVQLSRGVGPEDAPRPLLARQRGLAKGSRAPRQRPPALGGVRPGVPLVPPRAVGARGGCGRGAYPPSRPEGVSGGIRPVGGGGGPSAPPTAGGGRPASAPKSAGAARECHCARGNRGRDRWCGSPPSVVITGQGLTRSGRGRRGLERTGARGLARSLSPPPRGVWAATSPVHGAPVPRSPPPGRARLLSGSLPPTGSRAAQVPPFLSPFLGFSFCSFLSCWSLSLPFPHSPVRPPRLSADAGVSELLHWTFLASALLGSGWNFF